MKKYMVVSLYEGKQFASFFDTLQEAENHRMNGECGLGAYCEVYEYMSENEDDEDEPPAYHMIYS